VSGVVGSASLTVDPTPAALLAIQGSGQSDTVGAQLQTALIGEVQDAKGNPLAGETVQFTVIEGGGSVTPASATTDQNGQALTTWTLGTVAGAQRVRAQAATVSADFVAQALAGAAAEILKVQGDLVSGGLGMELSTPIEVKVVDRFQNGIAGVGVSFATDKGTLSVTSAITDSTGTATTRLTLPSEEGTVLVTATVEGLETVTFTITAEKIPLQVETSSLSDGRATLAFQQALEAIGGTGTGYQWSVSKGTLPDGLSIDPAGSISGTPAATGTKIFTVRVEDDAGHSAERELSLRVCEAPLDLQPGEWVVKDVPSPGTCGVFLPSGFSGDRYRVTVLNTLQAGQPSDTTTVTLTVNGVGVAPSSAVAVDAVSVARTSALRAFARTIPGLDPQVLERSIEIADATERYEVELRRQDEELVRRLGAEHLMPAHPRPRPRRAAAAAAAAAPQRLLLDPTTGSTCTTGGTKVPALLIADNDDMAIYQDSAQKLNKPVSVTDAQRMLDYYSSYAKDMIRAYFGEPSDINNDGRIVVFVSPVVKGNVAAFVWSGDLFPRSSCGNSNAMELVYFSADLIRAMDNADPQKRNWQALETVAHEVKHVVSLYHRISASNRMGSNQFHPSWIEEGTAEISGNMSSRIAWKATGGPEVGAKVTRKDFEQSGITKENYGVLLRMARTIWYLASQPNGIVITPIGAMDGHSIYGTGWNFHRWLGDAYGNAAAFPEADSTLFRSLSDSTAAKGIAGLQQYTGKSFEELLEEFVAAVSLISVGPTPERPFTSYDFVTSTDVLKDQPPGVYPWPVTTHLVAGTDSTYAITASFASATYQGTTGPTGVRIHDFQSDGTGVGADIHVEAATTSKLVVVRIR